MEGLEVQKQYSDGAAVGVCVSVCVRMRGRKCSSSATKGIVTDLKLPHLVPAVIAVLRPDVVWTAVIIPWALLFGEAQ